MCSETVQALKSSVPESRILTGLSIGTLIASHYLQHVMMLSSVPTHSVYQVNYLRDGGTAFNRVSVFFLNQTGGG